MAGQRQGMGGRHAQAGCRKKRHSRKKRYSRKDAFHGERLLSRERCEKGTKQRRRNKVRAAKKGNEIRPQGVPLL